MQSVAICGVIDTVMVVPLCVVVTGCTKFKKGFHRCLENNIHLGLLILKK